MFILYCTSRELKVYTKPNGVFHMNKTMKYLTILIRYYLQ